MAIIKQSTVFQRQFNLKLTGTQTGATGKAGSLVAKISKNGAALATPAGAVTELAQGAYVIAYTAADTNTVGSLGLYVTDAACDPYNAPDLDQILPGTLLTSGTGTDQLQVSGGGAFLSATEPVRQGLVPVSGLVNDGAPGAGGFITNLTNADPDHWINYNLEFITGACGGQQRQIASYTPGTKAVTLVRGFTRAPANGDQFNLISAPDVGAVTGMARVLGLSGDLMVEDDVVMDSNNTGLRKSWVYYIYDTEVNRAAHVFQSPNASRTGLRFKYTALRHIASGVVVDFSMTRVL